MPDALRTLASARRPAIHRVMRSSDRREFRQQRIQFRQHHDPLLITAGRMHDDPGTRRTRAIAGRMRHVAGDVDLLACDQFDTFL